MSDVAWYAWNHGASCKRTSIARYVAPEVILGTVKPHQVHRTFNNNQWSPQRLRRDGPFWRCQAFALDFWALGCIIYLAWCWDFQEGWLSPEHRPQVLLQKSGAFAGLSVFASSYPWVGWLYVYVTVCIYIYIYIHISYIYIYTYEYDWDAWSTLLLPLPDACRKDSIPCWIRARASDWQLYPFILLDLYVWMKWGGIPQQWQLNAYWYYDVKPVILGYSIFKHTRPCTKRLQHLSVLFVSSHECIAWHVTTKLFKNSLPLYIYQWWMIQMNCPMVSLHWCRWIH